MPFIYPVSQIQYEKRTLVMPVVSTANVSQLAVDLLIATLSLERIAIIDPSFFIPVIGGREDGKPGLTTPLELYGRSGLEIVILQQRSPVLKSRKEEFVTALFHFIKSSQFGAVLLLSGVDVTNRTDSQMLTPTYCLRPKNGPPLDMTPLSEILALPIPEYTLSVPQHLQGPERARTDKEPGIPFIPGGGLTRRILSSVPSGWSIPIVAILQFVMEGDNRADAHLLAIALAKVLGLDSGIREWRQPNSWKEGLFGAPTDQSLYG